MFFMLFLKNCLSNWKEFCKHQRELIRLKKKYPTCHFYPGAWIDANSRLGNYNVIFANSKVINSTIGSHTFVQKNSTIIYADIGKFCSIASRVSIGLGRHPVDWVSTHPAFYSSTQPLVKTFSPSDDFVPFKKTGIGHDVWIGENALITDGIKIETGAIIGAGAVVTKDVPAYAIVGGVPAKIIRYRFDDITIKKLLETKWWEMTDEWLKKNCHLFSNPEIFLKLFSG